MSETTKATASSIINIHPTHPFLYFILFIFSVFFFAPDLFPYGSSETMAGGFSLWRQRAQRPAPTRSPWASPGFHTLPPSLRPRCPSSHAPPPSP